MMIAASTGAAQESTSASVPERTLSSYLRSLADNPQSLTALMGAGRAALDLGDAQAALTFFGRAEEIAPADGRIKMWIGSALVQLEQPATALRFFDQAKTLGVPEVDFARDRGLAYDLGGDPGHAQRDYALVLKQRRDPEVTQRMALSLAISGKKAAALALLEDQLKQQDRTAWRIRTFVLALTGDIEGANRSAQSAMPAAQAAAMAPFFARLPSLGLAERAMAVHFGRIAGDGRTLVAQAQPDQAAPDLSAVIQAGRPDGRQPTLGTPPVSSSRQPDGSAASPADMRTSLSRAPANEAAPGFTPLTASPPTRSAATASQPVAQAQAQAPPRPQATPLPPSEAISTGPDQSSPETRRATTATGPSQPVQTPVQAQAEPASSAPPTRLSMADIAAAIAALKDEPPPQAPQPEAKSKAAAGPAATRRRQTASVAAPSAKARPAEPPARARARHWVQVAGGAAKTALPREYARLRAKAPALLGGRAAWTTPLNASNRLLVGPFDSEKEAQAFVNALAKADVAAFSWSSPAGQEIERLPAK